MQQRFIREFDDQVGFPAADEIAGQAALDALIGDLGLCNDGRHPPAILPGAATEAMLREPGHAAYGLTGLGGRLACAVAFIVKERVRLFLVKLRAFPFQYPSRR